MNCKKPDVYMTITPKNEIEICEKCPYPLPICGANGCAHFKIEKAKLLALRRDKRQSCGKKGRK